MNFAIHPVQTIAVVEAQTLELALTLARMAAALQQCGEADPTGSLAALTKIFQVTEQLPQLALELQILRRRASTRLIDTPEIEQTERLSEASLLADF